MKKVILSMAVIVCSMFAANAQEAAKPAAEAVVNPNAAEIAFVTETIDYGTIEHNADGNREFKYKNTGKENLNITNCKGSSGCTVPTWPKEPIKPGATSSIKVHYATDRVGQFEKTVTVTSNAKTASKVIKIKGVVKPDATPAEAPVKDAVAPTESH